MFFLCDYHNKLVSCIGLFNEWRSNRVTFTSDWVSRSSYDNVVSEGALTFKDLGIEPVPMEEAAYNMLRKYQKHQGYMVKNNFDYVKE